MTNSSPARDSGCDRIDPETALNEYLTSHPDEKSEVVIDLYRSELTDFVEWYLENVGESLHLLTETDLRDYLQHLQTTHQRPATVLVNVLLMLQPFLKWCEHKNYVPNGVNEHVPNLERLYQEKLSKANSTH